MKADVAAEWVKDLRSGQFQQGTGNLCMVEDGVPKYCCLGVLYKTAERLGVPVQTSLQEDQTIFIVGGERATLFPTQAVMDWAGLRSEDGNYTDYTDDERNLAAENDNGRTFAEIADIIEANVDAL